jgi:hypothetical protein
MPRGKEGRHEGDATGHNNPRKTTDITTGSSKKRSKNYGHDHAEERAHPGALAQDAKVHPMREGLSQLPHKADSRELELEGEKRSGSDSNAHSARKRSRLHEDHRDRNK